MSCLSPGRSFPSRCVSLRLLYSSQRQRNTRSDRHLPLMLSDHGQDVVGQVARVLGEPEELLELRLEELHLGLLPRQRVPHGLQDTRSTTVDGQAADRRSRLQVVNRVSFRCVEVKAPRRSDWLPSGWRRPSCADVKPQPLYRVTRSLMNIKHSAVSSLRIFRRRRICNADEPELLATRRTSRSSTWSGARRRLLEHPGHTPPSSRRVAAEPRPGGGGACPRPHSAARRPDRGPGRA
ncbi:hypothetical protein EYF80_060440 [Liparis tanakae]|uniref:Uncharacterized protein n=1 Tax=Liparis tanakae TaxID=230148 RepID=A0A4Z2ELH3_9TELE|nr:hypothetical protein EYF80_060440 [Liparis tanakae]